MGAGFCAEKYPVCTPSDDKIQPMLGTIGGYLEIRRKGGDWEKFAVTNYHCSRAAIPGYACKEKDMKDGEDPEAEEAEISEDCLLRAVDVDGLGPDRATEAQITYECPSRRVHNYTLKDIDQQIDNLLEAQARVPEDSVHFSLLKDEIDELRATKASKILHFDEGKQRLGRLWLCTGLKQRSSLNGRVDVAFIDVPTHRIGKNVIPSTSAWVGFHPPSTKASCGKLLRDIASCKAGAALGKVYKVGARTGGTTGRLSKIKSDVQIHWDSKVGMGMSREYCFVADRVTDNPAFQDAGDSGSFLFAMPTTWVGQTWGGSTKINAEQRLGYVTDAQDIIDWVGGWGGESEFEARLPEG